MSLSGLSRFPARYETVYRVLVRSCIVKYATKFMPGEVRSLSPSFLDQRTKQGVHQEAKTHGS